jgi:hypothetical protein
MHEATTCFVGIVVALSSDNSSLPGEVFSEVVSRYALTFVTLKTMQQQQQQQ